MTEDTIPQPGPKLNREERRAKARFDRKAAVKAARQGKLSLDPESASKLLLETVTVNRWDAVNRVLTALFSEDIDGKVMRLVGIGGATGVITKEALEVAASAAIQSGVMLPQTGPDAVVDADLTPEQAATEGGVVLTPESEAAVESILAHAEDRKTAAAALAHATRATQPGDTDENGTVTETGPESTDGE